MSNTQAIVVPAAAEDSVTALVRDGEQYDTRLTALHDAATANDREAFDAAWQEARGLVRDTDALQTTVNEAASFVATGQAAIDAHTTYRVGLVGERRAFLPRESKADLARALYGDTDDTRLQNTREVMVGRDLKAVEVVNAVPRRRLSVPEVLKVVNRATKDDMKGIVARAVAGEPLAKDAAAARVERQEAAAKRKAEKKFTLGEVNSALSDVLDMLAKVSDAGEDEAVRKAVLSALAKVEAGVHRLPLAKVEAPAEDEAATA